MVNIRSAAWKSAASDGYHRSCHAIYRVDTTECCDGLQALDHCYQVQSKDYHNLPMLPRDQPD